MSRASRAPASVVVDCSGVGAGGITRVLTELVRHWPAGWRLRIVAAPSSWDAHSEEHAADVEIVSRQKDGRVGTIASAAAALWRVTGRAARDGAGVVLSLSPSAALLGSRLPVVTLLHDLAFKLWPHDLPTSVRQYRRVSYAAAIRRSERLLCVSARTQHDLLGLYGVPPERARIWHPGSDLTVLPGGLPEPLARIKERGERYLLIAGHAAHKGVELAVDALPHLPEYALVVLTGGQPVGRFQEAAARSTARDRILLLERLSDAGYAAALADAAVFLMPSHFEGYGLPAAEALRVGTRTVVSPDPALHEATGGRAVRMTSWSAQSLVAAVRAAEQAPRPAVGQAGRSWQEATADLVALLDGAPSDDRRPVPAGAGG